MSNGTEPSTLPAEGHQLLRSDAEILPTYQEEEEPTLRTKYNGKKEREREKEQVDLDPHSADNNTTFGSSMDDNVLRYSYKGTPPELYSPKKEFLYTQPLVEKQLVLKKSCEWMFYKYKYSRNMSTHWRQPASILVSLLVLFIIGGVIFLLSSAPSHSTSIRLDEIQIPTQFINDTVQVNWIDKPNIVTEDNDDDIGDINNVKPIKVLNISLNEEDRLYESKRNSYSNSSQQRDGTSAFSMTGTFRSKSSQIWDPHPEYLLDDVFGHRLHLVLHQDSSFVPSKTFRFIRILNNHTEESDDDIQESLDCYYTGYVDGDNQSSVAVSLCGGMTGYIKTSFGSVLIQPVNKTNSDEVWHRVWRHSMRNPRHAVSELDMALEAFELATEKKNKRQLLTRNKRHFFNQRNQVYTLEVLLAVDYTMKKFHKEELKSYILTLFRIVSSIFADASIGNSIHISLINMMYLNTEDNRRFASTTEKLKYLCSYFKHAGFRYDTAMVITRDQICDNERGERCSTLGLAELGTACKPSSCSIVQDNGLSAAFTIAHELGHVLNMPHDDDDRCRRHNTKPGNNLHIMSSVMGDHMHPFSWSKCSQHYVSEFLEKMDNSCLENTPHENFENFDTKLPGEIYSLNHQCRLAHGNQSTHCQVGAECSRLWCNANSRADEMCRSTNLPWADGTPCNHDRYWCHKGKCVPREGSSALMVHGGWSPWSEFTPCSLTCSGGVQESRRECNDPLPANGGKYCVGSRKKYRACNTHACPVGTPDSREQQCYNMNGKNLKIPGIKPSAKWVPKYGLNADDTDKCKLYCRLEDNSAYFKLAEMVHDGTTCTVDSFDKCVNGICRPAGCDNELNSIAKLDKCGVCEGRNDTCEEHASNVYVSDLLNLAKPPQGIYYITTIPKGASNIVITQPGYPTQNWIVISNDDNIPLLNCYRKFPPKNADKAVAIPYPTKCSYAGVTIDYNGSNSTVERVKTTYSFKTTRSLIVELISIGLDAAQNQDTILMSYSYTLDKPYTAEPEVEIYRWQMQTWSSCDSLCQGSKHRQAACVSTTQGLKVANQFCDGSAMPKPEYSDCNTDCVLTLNTTSISECSASCGELGTREKKFNCIQTYPNIQRDIIVDMSYCELKFEIKHHEQCREGCWNYTDWSSCTKTCGTGTQVREVRCYLNGSPVRNEVCNPRTKYELNDKPMRTCSIEPCRFYPDVTINTRSVNHWMAGEWGECSEWCKTNRTVTCTHPYGNHCPLDLKPKAVKNCCHIRYTSEWETCSVKCGTGQSRHLQKCTRVFKAEVPGTSKRKEYIDDSFCTSLRVRKPKLRRLSKQCTIKCKWVESEWSKVCQNNCAEGYETRHVRCYQDKKNGTQIDESYCKKRRPPTRKRCRECLQRTEYKVWKPCDCQGLETVRVPCSYSQRRRGECMKSKLQKRKCNPPPRCSARNLKGKTIALYSNPVSEVRSRRPQTCQEYQQMYREYKDGEYWLDVRGRGSKMVLVYCYQMNTVEPKEYITVEPQENYSIYYEYRTRHSNECPPASRAHEYPNPVNSGRTNFHKLRLNIRDLRIIENDYVFAKSIGHPQALGSAGDCYNDRMTCPQGDFSISLNRTQFTIRPGTKWEKYGNHVIMDTSNTFHTSPISRRAFCGGYCGRCSISESSGLYVDVA